MNDRHSAGTNELVNLFDALLSNEISAADVDSLKARLRHDESARLLYVEYMDLHSELLQVLNPDARPEELLVAGPPQQPHRWTLLVASLAAAAMVLIAVSFVWQRVKPDGALEQQVAHPENQTAPVRAKPVESPLPVVARIVGEVDAQWIDSPLAADLGVALHSGDAVELGDGTAEVEFSSGVRCFVSGSATLVIHSSMACALEYGTATFHVPKAARGFRVSTPGGEITDLGTAFGVSTASDGCSEVHVFEGIVQAAAPGDRGRVLTLSHRCAGLLDPISHSISIADYMPEKFSRPLSVAAGVRELPQSVLFLPTPPPSLRPGSLNGNGRAILFVERTGVICQEDLLPGTVDIGRVVRYQTEGKPREAANSGIPAGTRVDSFLLQFGNERADVQRSEVSGKLVFAEPILQVILTAEQLASTKSTFGHPGLDYPYDLNGVGLEHDDQHPDRLVISPDRRTLEFSLCTSARFLDQVRIILRHTATGPAEATGSQR